VTEIATTNTVTIIATAATTPSTIQTYMGTNLTTSFSVSRIKIG
jgi:hypothetical protein